MKTLLIFTMLAICIQLPDSAFAQTAQSHPRVITTTRLVAQYSDLEQRLNQSIQHRDKIALSKLLSDDFEQWTPAPPGDPIPREDWLQNQLTTTVLRSYQMRQMAVRTFGDIAVVSFVEDLRVACAGRDCSATHFIVDLWQTHNGVTQLVVRYDSEKLAQQSPQQPSRPTGKE